MAKYRMGSGLREVKEQPDFESDQEAWEYLRKVISGPNNRDIFVTLYKQLEVTVPYNNALQYVDEHNSKYGPRPFGMGGDHAVLLDAKNPKKEHYWVPVLDGLSSHKYNLDYYNKS